MKNKYFVLFVIVFLSPLWIFAQSERPKVGLVLSGGGAKGFAHIGVLKVIEEAGVPIDVVSGTSMGSIIGGLYAIGYNAEMIEKIILEQNWVDLFNDNITRHEISIQEKLELSRYVGGFPIYGTKVGLPTGLMVGQKVSAMLSRLTWSMHHVEDFDDFPRPFRCVATDIETGKPYVFKSGYLPEAIRASMAIPSVFTPVRIQGKMLVDGGIVRNLPVQEAVDMGADYIIAVDVTNPLFSQKELDSFFEILNQTINFQTVAKRDEQLSMCDLYIYPNIEGYTIFDFFKADSLIHYGEMKAREFLPQLTALADSLKKYNEPVRISAPATDIQFVDIVDVKVSGLSRVPEYVVTSNIGLKIPSRVTPEDIEKAVDRLYGSQLFERVTYQLKSTSDGTILILYVVENTTNLLNFGLNYSNRHDATILLNGTFRNLLGHGSKLSLDNKLGHNRELGVNYFYHTIFKPAVGFGFDVRAKESDFDNFADHVRIARYNLFNMTLGLQLKALLTNGSAIGLNIQRQRTVLDPSVVSNKSIRDITNDYFNTSLELDIDTFDHAVFPVSGMVLHAEGKYFHMLSDPVALDKSFVRYFLDLKRVRKLTKKSAFRYELVTGYYSGDMVPVEQLFYFGGYHYYENYMFPFAGLDYMEIAARNLIIGRTALQFKVFAQQYFSAGLAVGIFHDRYQELFSNGSRIWSGSLSYGMDTPLGPVKFSIASNNREKDLQGYLSIGHWF